MMCAMLRRLPPFFAAALLAAGALSGCGSSHSGAGSPSGSAGSTGTPGAAASPATKGSARPSQSVPLTAQGAKLKLGQKATLAWSPRQHVDGVLDVTVTAMQSTTYKQSFSGWQVDAQTMKRAPYFVRARVTNAGTTDLGGYAVPLYGLDAANNLVEASTFASSFAPCQPGTLPKRFPHGASAQVCLVYLVPEHGKLTGVSFRPTEKFNPITWTGAVQPYTPPKPKKHGGKG